jgi:hypothetical protein
MLASQRPSNSHSKERRTCLHDTSLETQSSAAVGLIVLFSLTIACSFSVNNITASSHHPLRLLSYLGLEAQGWSSAGTLQLPTNPLSLQLPAMHTHVQLERVNIIVLCVLYAVPCRIMQSCLEVQLD